MRSDFDTLTAIPQRRGRRVVAELLKERMDGLHGRIGRPGRGSVIWWAEYLDRHVSTVSCWRTGARPVPRLVFELLNALEELERAAGPNTVLALVNRRRPVRQEALRRYRTFSSPSRNTYAGE